MNNSSKAFMNFIKLEKDLKKLEKEHAVLYIKRISLELQKEIDEESIIDKIKNYFIEIKEVRNLNKIIKKYKEKYKNLKTEDKTNKLVYNKSIELDECKVHFEIKRKFYLRTIAGEFAASRHEYLSFTAYMFLEYNDIKTDNYFLKEFENQNDAVNYLKNIEKEYNLKNLNNVLIKLSNHISNHMNELNERIRLFS